MSPIYILLSVLAAVLPATAYLIFIWWLDRYEREPAWLVGLTFVYGGTGAIIFGVMGSGFLMGVVAGSGHHVTQLLLAGFIAPVTEEPAKAIVLLALLLGRNFDNTTDGLVYGAATGLGFSVTENFLYFLGPYQAGDIDQWWQLVLIRGSFTALMHCAASATVGAFLGRYRYQSLARQWLLAPLLGLGGAMLLHGAFNSLVTVTAETGEPFYGVTALAIVPVVGLGLFVVTQLALISEHRMIQRELEAEARHGVLPIEHARVIPYANKRRRRGWIPDGMDRKAYLRATTLLAFRRHQARLQGKPTNSANQEVHKLRMEIQHHLARAGLVEMPPPNRRMAGPFPRR